MDIARMAATFGNRPSRARRKGYGGARRLFMALLAAALCATLIPGQAGAAQSKTSGLADTVTAQAAAVTAEVRSTGCASGPRFDRFIKAMLLVSSSNGWSFQSVCNSTVDYRDGQAREGTILVRFRDRQHRLRYVGWYDSRLDQKGRKVFAGGSETITLIARERATGEVWSYRHLDAWFRWLYQAATYGNLFDPNAWMARQIETKLTFSSHKGCGSGVYTYCAGGSNFQEGAREYYMSVWDGGGVRENGSMPAYLYSYDNDSVPYQASSGRLLMTWEKHVDDEPFMLGLIKTFVLTVTFGLIGKAIGILLGASGAVLSGITAAVGTLATGLLSGKDVASAFLDALISAAIAYSGRLVLNRFGDPTGLVGVAGEGCPFGDECWYMRLAGEVPFMKGLAEAHDAFIQWSQTAWASVGHNPFFLAVTIPPFLVPGCASSPGCTTAGIVIAREDEIW